MSLSWRSMTKQSIVLIALLCLALSGQAQVNENKTGAWYMYFWNTTFTDSQWGLQGDVQYRNWNVMGDLEQLLLRGGVTYQLKDFPMKLTQGYAHITTGAYGESSATVSENRLYQEALIPHGLGSGRFHLTHRLRFEQRFVDGQDFRTRFRYFLMCRVALNKPQLEQGTLYLAAYNELFINGQRDIGNGMSVDLFDRNRVYGALGWLLKDNLAIQAGFMQQATVPWTKHQWQLSLHHTF